MARMCFDPHNPAYDFRVQWLYVVDRLGWNSAELARFLGLSMRTVQAWLDGERTPRGPGVVAWQFFLLWLRARYGLEFPFTPPEPMPPQKVRPRPRRRVRERGHVCQPVDDHTG